MNRIADAIARRRDQLARGVKPDGSPITVDLGEVERTLANTFSEHAHYQDLQSHAFASGTLNLEEAHTVYLALGEVPGPDGWARDTDLAAKLVITSLMAELIDKEIAARRRAYR